ncbi:MAG: FKBP-type peptidyl-prolyl cis-trans isomerase [Vicinamibacterales bacterium]|nr:FKBP-type peptidyl-prolyl cis-trans isomerase [Vicinamibacterales bacterium]
MFRESLRFLSAAVLALFVAGCGGPSSTDPNRAQAPMTNSGISELQVVDTVPGTGAEARPGMTVSVHYTGWLFDAAAPAQRGNKFDSSKDRNEAFDFPLGAGQVIPGWDQGVAGMKVGGTRVLTIPPALAYGPSGAGGVIPPNATLVFEVELLEVR